MSAQTIESGMALQSALTAFLDGDVPGQISAWLATYLVHGVCLFLLAAVAVRFIKSARCAEQLWRAALFGPLVTASLQLGAGLQPALGHWELPGRDALVAEVEAPAIENELDALQLREAAILARLAELGDQLAVVTDASSEVIGERTDDKEPALAAPAPVRNGMGLGSLLAVIALAAGIAALMLGALLEAIRIHRLGERARLMSGPVVDTVQSLARRASIRRSIRVEVTPSGSSPFATGVFFPRIVVPQRALTQLDAASMQAMLAHEIGHVARFDPLWTAAARSVAALFFFQPLNWLMVKRLDESAEYCCDEFAVDVTGNEVALARCLATVAEWIVGGSTSVRAACPMAHRNSPLASRVNRILATDGLPAGPLGPLRWMGGAAVLATALAAPGFAARSLPLVTPVLIEEPTSMGVLVHSSPLEALEFSVVQLVGEIEELIVVASEREVHSTTIQRLRSLQIRAQRVLMFAQVLQEKASRLVR